LYNVLKLNTANVAAATLSKIGSVELTMTGVIAINWCGSFLFSTVENYILNNMSNTKAVILSTKFMMALPICCVEWTSNAIFGFPEKIFVEHQLPTNITEVYKLSVGPKLKDINELKKPVINWLIDKLKN